MVAITEPLTAEEKQSALAHVLKSQTLERCDQLKQFLRYIVEQEIAGHAEEITEYAIGVHALGRAPNFLPSGDSSVRTRAHALRKKLEEFYREEAPDERIRIQLPKGSYSPRFIRIDPPAQQVLPAVPVRIFEPVTEGAFYRKNPVGIAIAAFLAGILITSAAALLMRESLVRAGIRSEIPAHVKEAWGPFLKQDAEPMLVLATPLQLFVRDYADQPRPLDPVWAPELPENKDLLQWYGRWQPTSGHTRLLLHPNTNSPLWGDAAAASAATATLSRYKIPNTLVRERLLKPYVLRDRNVMLFGRAEYSETIRLKMHDLPFQIVYNSDRRTFLIANSKPGKGEPAYYEPSGPADSEREVYGLITVLPSDSSDKTSKRTVIFSGLTSAGTQAAYEFFASEERLSELKASFEREGIHGFPPSYQVIVDVRTDETLPLQYRYRTHRVF